MTCVCLHRTCRGAALCLASLALLAFPRFGRAECKEFKIVEYDDRVEAVCVGEPLTEAQKKANLEEEKRQETETARQKGIENARQKAAATAEKSKADAEAAAERRKRNTPPVVTPPVNKGAASPQILFR